MMRSDSRRVPRLPRLLGACLLLAAGAAAAQDYADISRRIDSGQYGPINSLLVQQHGRLRHEDYFRSQGPEDLQLLNSVTKSVGATLIGLAQRRGLLQPADSIEQLLPHYDWSSQPYARHRQLSLQQVLQMRHGIDWDEWSWGFTDPRNSAVQMFAAADWYSFTLSRQRAAPAGSGFGYSSGVSTLMSGVLRQATGESPQQLFAQWLGAPLGITQFDWELWSPAGPGSGLRSFPFGDAPLGVGLWLRPRDLLKIGQLYLDDGVVDGRRLLDPEWIRASWTAWSNASTDAYFAESTEPAGYGYQWWFRELLDVRGRRHPCWYANGAGRQYLVVCPQRELVVVSTGESYDDSGPGLFTLLREDILPALPYPINASLSALYYDPAFEGQGVSIEVAEDRGLVVVAWYTHAEGRQRWYVMQGPIIGDRVTFAEVLQVEGGQFLAAGPPQIHSVGSASIEWDSCREARLNFAITQGSGEYRLQRLVSGCD